MHRLFACTIPLLAATLSAQSAADFLPPARGGTKELARPEAVRVARDDQLGLQLVTAETVQDAANKARELTELESGLVAFECAAGGIGLMATATATYLTDTPNPNAIQYSKRTAFTEAYLAAKVIVVEYLHGLQSESRQNFARRTTMETTGEASSFESQANTTESIDETVDGSVRAVTIFGIDDDGEGTVTVSAYVTPQCFENARGYAGIGVEAKDIKAGLDFVFDELRNFTVPPAGSRVIMVPSTGEMAFIGFGCEVVPVFKNRQARIIAQKNARETAAMRARNALVAALSGEKVTASRGSSSEQRSSFETVERYGERVDPNPEKSSDQVGSWVDGFHGKRENTEVMESVSAGHLPPGVNMKTYELKGWLYSVAVFLPGSNQGLEELTAPDKPKPAVNPLGPKGVTAPDPRKQKGKKYH